MEDFGSKFQNIENNVLFKKIIRISFNIFLVILSIIILYNIVKLFRSNENNNFEEVRLIKSEVKEIKIILQNKKEQYSSIYDIFDKDKTLKEINTIETIQNYDNNIDRQKNENDFKNDILDQYSLERKIDEIYDDNNTNSIKIDNNTNPIKINVNKIKENKNSDLTKLGNKSLINNIKNNKHLKPGVRIQIMASKDKKKIMNYWEKLKNSYPNLFSDKNYYIENAILNEEYLYRFQLGVFEDYDKANDFCKKYISVTNKNKYDCIVIKN